MLTLSTIPCPQCGAKVQQVSGNGSPTEITFCLSCGFYRRTEPASYASESPRNYDGFETEVKRRMRDQKLMRTTIRRSFRVLPDFALWNRLLTEGGREPATEEDLCKWMAVMKKPGVDCALSDIATLSSSRKILCVLPGQGVMTGISRG